MTGFPFRSPRESHWSGVTRSLKSGALSRRKGSETFLFASFCHARVGTVRQDPTCVALGPVALTAINLWTTAACGGLRSTPDCQPRRTFLHLSYAPPCGPALLVTQCQFRTHALQQTTLRVARTHSITSSAATSRPGVTVRPSILAVWALMTSSNLLDCTTGRSAGLAPLRMLPV